MRLNFANLTRPKRASRALQNFLPFSTLSESQELIASLCGYRDWHELVAITKSALNAPTPDQPSGEPPQGPAESVTHRFYDHFGHTGVIWGILPDQLGLVSPQPPSTPRRAAGVPGVGAAFFRLIQVDFLTDMREGGAGLDWDDLYCLSAPASEASVVAKLLQKIRKKPKYPDFPEECAKLFSMKANAPMVFECELVNEEGVPEAWVLSQKRLCRELFFDADDQPVGFVQYSTSLMAASDTMEMDVVCLRVHESWWQNNHVRDGICANLSDHVTWVLGKMGVAWPPEYRTPVTLEVISESEHLAAIPSMLRNTAYMIEDSLVIKRGSIEISYDT